MSHEQATSDLTGVLEKIRGGAEVIVEQDRRPVAVIRAAFKPGRLLSECIAIADARESTVTLDEGFTKDGEEGIASPSQPWNPPAWGVILDSSIAIEAERQQLSVGHFLRHTIEEDR